MLSLFSLSDLLSDCKVSNRLQEVVADLAQVLMWSLGCVALTEFPVEFVTAYDGGANSHRFGTPGWLNEAIYRYSVVLSGTPSCVRCH
jgi:hypothetical protein